MPTTFCRRSFDPMPERTRVSSCVTMAAVALAFMWATSAEACEPTSAYQAVVAPARGISTTTVPVVIHIMERPGHECETRDLWTSTKLRLLFGPNENNDGTIASIWGVTDIRFVVQKVVRHTFDPPSDLMDASGEVTTPASGPIGTPQWEVAFSELVRKFHRKGSVNVYLWRTLANDIAGFGRSPRSGLGKATVWLAGKCVDATRMTVVNCTRVSAHELGHALGLYHSGAGRCSTVQPEFQPICMTTTASCGETSEDERLMKSGADGRMLCRAEVTEAEDMVPRLQ
jgi:hypothetical protein